LDPGTVTLAWIGPAATGAAQVESGADGAGEYPVAVIGFYPNEPVDTAIPPRRPKVGPATTITTSLRRPMTATLERAPSPQALGALDVDWALM